MILDWFITINWLDCVLRLVIYLKQECKKYQEIQHQQNKYKYKAVKQLLYSLFSYIYITFRRKNADGIILIISLFIIFMLNCIFHVDTFYLSCQPYILLPICSTAKCVCDLNLCLYLFRRSRFPFTLDVTLYRTAIDNDLKCISKSWPIPKVQCLWPHVLLS